MLGYFASYWDTWNAQFKVTFDGPNRLILINQDIVNLDIKSDFYTAWKKWMLFNEVNNLFYPEAFASLGGDPISDIAELGSTFFLENGWRIKPWDGHKAITITGNIYVREGGRPIIPDNNGNDSVSLTVSNLVDTVIIDNTSGEDTLAPTWIGAEGITDLYQDGETITVRWGSAIDNSNTQVHYNIYLSINPITVFETYNLLHTVEGNMYTMRYEDNAQTPFTPGETYYIGIRAIDQSGNETLNNNYGFQLFTQAISGQDVNIVSVQGVDVISVDDFKADTVNVDLSGIPQAVWEYTTRELTVAAGLTPAQEIIINDILTNTTNIDTQVWSSNTRDLTNIDANITQVNGTNVYNIDEFKATDVDVDSIVSGLLNTDIHTYTSPNTVGDMIHRISYLERKIYIDTELLVNGDGSQDHPFNNFNDGKDSAEELGIYIISLHGTATIPSNFKNFTIEGIGVPVINTNGQDLKNSKFYQCHLQGDYTNTIIAQDCILNNFTINGFFETCAIVGTLTCVNNGQALISNCMSGLLYDTDPIVDMNSGGESRLKISNHSGDIIITNMDHINDFSIVEIAQGKLTINSSCILGNLIARGNCYIIENQNGTTVIDETLSTPKIIDGVWSNSDRTLTYIKPDIISSDTIEVNINSNLGIKINTNPLFETYIFDVYYRIAGMTVFEDLGIQLTEIELDNYVGTHIFTQTGSYVIKFVETTSKIDDIFTTISVIEPNTDAVLKETWEITL